MKKEKMNYRIIDDSYYSSIALTKSAPDGYSIFSSLSEAKRELLDKMHSNLNEWKDAIKRTKLIKVTELEQDDLFFDN